ncbi:MAG: bifunctional diaminohydroxyphosphoribosylaminopyrimidine deaminase/5-amino-6-(5-phosphoribosylamino)uracil reductase RibD, partial [Gammaproteobacteria bacterium]
MTAIDDYHYMALALRLAQRGLYTTSPNPRVGCVLVRDGSVVGEGWHRRAGEPHAEVNALQQAGSLARGATGYVTLEPCCHHGRTPPCTDA